MKTNLTKSIESTLRTYSPKEIAGYEMNYSRASFSAFEVPVERGTNKAGMVDCVSINEYFAKIEHKDVCYASVVERSEHFKKYYWAKMKDLCLEKREAPLEFCDKRECELCKPLFKTMSDPQIMFTCYEIKISKADFLSTNGHNFVGNANYYVVPTDLAKEIRHKIKDHIGVIAYQKGGSLRKIKEAYYRVMTDEDQKWLMLSCMVRYSKAQKKIINDVLEGSIHYFQ